MKFQSTLLHKAEDASVLALLVKQSKLIFVELLCLQTNYVYSSLFFFTRGLNNYFAYSPTKILYSKVKPTNGHTGSGDKWSFDPEKNLLLSSCCCCIWMHLICPQFSTSVESPVVSVTKTSRNITIHTTFLLKHPLVAKGTWGSLLLPLYVLLPSLFLSYPCSKPPM